jgi:hypothetical protein
VRRRLLRALLVLLVLAFVAWGWASVDRCGPWQATPPALVGIGRATGMLRVGAAVVAIAPKYPVTLAGYGPPRPRVERAAQPVNARATVVEVGGQRLALVALDTLLVTSALRASLQEATGITTWLIATHTHSSLGGYDPRLVSEVAALGTYDAAQEEALLAAAKNAVAQATQRLAPAQLDIATAEAPGLNVARSGNDVERALTRVRFTGAHGPIAQWVVFSAHPTLVPRRADALDPDWPGRLATTLERDGGPVTLVLQGGGGNASVDRTKAATPDAFADALAARLATLRAGSASDARAAGTGPGAADTAVGASGESATANFSPDTALELAWADVAFALPRPDATRLVPGPLRAAAENALCEDAEHEALVSALRLGRVTFLLVPVEPSAAAARVLADQAGALRVLSNANGSLGYVEPEGVARDAGGESTKQYFDAGFLQRLADAVRLAGRAVAPAR